MDELVKQITARTGSSEAQAQTAVDTVLGFLKTRLPAPLAGQLMIITSARGWGWRAVNSRQWLRVMAA